MSEFPISSPTGQAMLERLPDLYSTIYETRVMMQDEGTELDALKTQVSAAFDQYFVATATWGLERWEAEFGIVPAAGQPDDQRRSVIRSRIRGTGTVTIEMMKNVAEAYDRGAIEVTEQPALYRFTVRFVDTLGAPPNLDDLKKAIESIKPAHLVVAYQYKYLLVNQVQGMSITDLQQSRLTDFAPFIPV